MCRSFCGLVVLLSLDVVDGVFGYRVTIGRLDCCALLDCFLEYFLERVFNVSSLYHIVEEELGEMVIV